MVLPSSLETSTSAATSPPKNGSKTAKEEYWNLKTSSYQKIIKALVETDRVMREIDGVSLST